MKRLKLLPWKLEFIPGWDGHFEKFGRTAKDQILKKFEHMKQPLQARGLHSSIFQVEEVGQYRISFKIDGQNRIKKIQFVGNHKQYEKWYKEE